MKGTTAKIPLGLEVVFRGERGVVVAANDPGKVKEDKPSNVVLVNCFGICTWAPPSEIEPWREVQQHARDYMRAVAPPVVPPVAKAKFRTVIV